MSNAWMSWRELSFGPLGLLPRVTSPAAGRNPAEPRRSGPPGRAPDLPDRAPGLRGPHKARNSRAGRPSPPPAPGWLAAPWLQAARERNRQRTVTPRRAPERKNPVDRVVTGRFPAPIPSLQSKHRNANSAWQGVRALTRGIAATRLPTEGTVSVQNPSHLLLKAVGEIVDVCRVPPLLVATVRQPPSCLVHGLTAKQVASCCPAHRGKDECRCGRVALTLSNARDRIQTPRCH